MTDDGWRFTDEEWKTTDKDTRWLVAEKLQNMTYGKWQMTDEV